MNIETLKNKLQNIKPGQWVIIAVAVVGAFYIFYPRNSSGSAIPAEEAYSSVGDSSSVSAGNDQTLSQLVNDTQEGFDILTSQLENLKEDNDSLKSDYQIISTEFTNYQRNTDKQIEEVGNSFASRQTESSFDSALAGLGSIYTDKDDDAAQFNSILENVVSAKSSGDLTSSQAGKVVSTVAGLGNNGVNYNPTKAAQTLTDIKNDASLKASELTRTNEVIKNRQAAGLDTTAQKNYLKSITNL